jgi:hypothetical protein
MFRSFADVQTAAMLELPRPGLKGDKPDVVPCPMSDEQREIQARLVERYERIRSQKVDPREDNALAITTDGRKLSLDGRLISKEVPEYVASKSNALVSRVADTWRSSHEIKGTQLIFCDLGVNPTPWGYSVYEELTAKLIGAGVPRGQIAAVGDADSDAKKQALFERVRQGTVRVLIGSTQKMGTGANVQRRLCALHHLDAPWKPAEVEQREGRILRQGNENKEVSIFRYVTEGSFDAYMWQALETKQKFILQIMTGETCLRRAEDIGGQELSYAEVKAIASGNPAILTLAETDAELQRLSVLRKHHGDEQFLARRNVRELPEVIAHLRKRLKDTAADLQTAKAHEEDEILVGSVRCSRDKLQSVLGEALDALPLEVKETRKVVLGKMRGMTFGIVKHRLGPPEVFLQGQTVRQSLLSRGAEGPRACLNALSRLFQSYESACEELRRELSLFEGKLRDFTARLGSVFPHERYIEELTTLRDELKVALSATQDETDPKQRSTAEIAELITTLRESHVVEPLPVTRKAQAAALERPVTARIRMEAQESCVPLEPEEEPHDAREPKHQVPEDPVPTLSLTAPKIPPRPRQTPTRRRYQKWLF